MDASHTAQLPVNFPTLEIFMFCPGFSWWKMVIFVAIVEHVAMMMGEFSRYGTHRQQGYME